MENTLNFKRLERERLQKKIEEATEAPMTYVTAPLGYGKTTAVRFFLTKNSKRYLWISIGQQPVSDEWVWNKIMREVAKHHQDLYQQLMGLGGGLFTEEWQENEEMLLTILQRELSEKEIYFVLDDYHCCNGPAFNRLLTRLVYEDIVGFHMILISRSYVDIPIEEMELKGYCVMIEPEDFLLTQDETLRLLKINGIETDGKEAEKIYDYTDGWIAAVNLLWYDYQKSGTLQYSESVNRLLCKYIETEFSQEDRELFYILSLFAELNLEELEWLSGQTVRKSRMNPLMEKTGLIHFNSQNFKYSMHTLLREAVQEDTTILIDMKEVYKSYAEYLEKERDRVAAIEYYDRAGDRASILRLLEQSDRYVIMEQIPRFVESFCEREEDWQEIIRNAKAGFTIIYFLVLSSDASVSDRGKRMFRYAWAYYEEKAEEIPEARKLLGELMVIDSLLQFNDIEASNQSLTKAWELLEHNSSRIFSRNIYSYGVPATIHMYHRRPGDLRWIVEEEKKYSRNCMRLFYNTQSSLEHLVNAEFYLETGEVRKALEEAGKELDRAKFRNQACMVISSYLVIGRCHIYLGNQAEFETAMNDCELYMKHIAGDMLAMDYDQTIGYVYALTGKLEKVPIWLRYRQLDKCNLIVRDSRNGCIIYGIYLCRRKKWEQLLANAEEMACPYADTRHVFAEIYAGIFRGIALWNGGNCEDAVKSVLGVIALAGPDEIRMPFMELSEELMPILLTLEQENPYAAGLIPCCRQWLAGAAAFWEGSSTEPHFTRREHEILGLLSEGFRNSEIGAKMNIAQVTVEKNLTSIYRKIGVSNRTSAARWYRDIFLTITQEKKYGFP